MHQTSRGPDRTTTGRAFQMHTISSSCNPRSNMGHLWDKDRQGPTCCILQCLPSHSG